MAELIENYGYHDPCYRTEHPSIKPDKPSIAVLPFDNLSGVSDQEYLADGITENIITALSYIPEIFVIARNSTFTYKGEAIKAQVVAQDLGVRYILEGSVRQEGDRVRKRRIWPRDMPRCLRGLVGRIGMTHSTDGANLGRSLFCEQLKLREKP